jgi:hypothetical protein
MPATTTVTASTTTTLAPTTITAVTPTTIPGEVVVQRCYLVAHAKGKVHVRDSPGGAIVQTFDRVNVVKKLASFLVSGPMRTWEGSNWVEILYPGRPNGSMGWVASDEVTVSWVSTAVVVRLGAHSLSLYKMGREVASYPVGLGTATDPTPTGDFFVIGVLKLHPGGVYGPWALVTSAFSETLADWPYGGVVGIHGTNDPSSVGRNVSHGCIRMNNGDITQVAVAVDLGTPIFIVP